MRPELEEKWEICELKTEPSDLNQHRFLVISATPFITQGENFRMGGRTSNNHPHPHSPYAVAGLMDTMSLWIKSRFNPDGTLTEKGKANYLRNLEKTR